MIKYLYTGCVLAASVAVTMMANTDAEFEIAILSWFAGAGGCHLVNYSKWEK